jgi:RNA recognition motif-containing protein
MRLVMVLIQPTTCPVQRIGEKKLFFVLREAKANVASARICRDATGASKGFAFVSFSTIGDAQHWVEKQRGYLRLDDRVIRVEYMKNQTWNCPKCGTENWKKEELGCFKCNKDAARGRLLTAIIKRFDSNLLRVARDKFNDGTMDIGQSPTYLVLIRNIAPSTSEEKVIFSFHVNSSRN